MSFSSVVAVALGAVLTATTSAAPVSLTTQPAFEQLPQAQTVQQYVDNYFKDEPVMVAIAGCESRFTQYGTDGQVLKNPNSSAVGVFQIMASVHASLADKELGIDINTLQGNVAYAQYLYQKEGTVPWAASQACWGKTKSHSEGQTLATAAK